MINKYVRKLDKKVVLPMLVLAFILAIPIFSSAAKWYTQEPNANDLLLIGNTVFDVKSPGYTYGNVIEAIKSSNSSNVFYKPNKKDDWFNVLDKQISSPADFEVIANSNTVVDSIIPTKIYREESSIAEEFDFAPNQLTSTVEIMSGEVVVNQEFMIRATIKDKNGLFVPNLGDKITLDKGEVKEIRQDVGHYTITVVYDKAETTSFIIRVEGISLATSDVEVKGPVVTQPFKTEPAIVAGNGFTVALKEDGTVWAWGQQEYGKLGNNTTSSGSVTTPHQVQNLTEIIAIAAGYDHAIALKNDGTVWVWGRNNRGQLGTGNTNTSSRPVQLTLPKMKAISANKDHTLALTETGEVYAWGNAQYGKLGDGNTTTSSFNSPTPKLISNFNNVIGISAGSDHSMALKSDGTVWVWGYNNRGQLGTGNTTSRSTPVEVTNSNIRNIKEVVAGKEHSLALKGDGTVWAWGYEKDGRLGNGSTSEVNRSTPIQITALSQIQKIITFSDHSFALKSDKRVLAWGVGSDGRIGNNSTSNVSTPVTISSLSNVKLIAAGENHSFAVNNDGIVYAWGNNGSGQLGIGNTSSRSTPTINNNITLQ